MSTAWEVRYHFCHGGHLKIVASSCQVNLHVPLFPYHHGNALISTPHRLHLPSPQVWPDATLNRHTLRDRHRT